MAEILFQDILAKKDIAKEGWQVASAGCWALPDMAATQKAQKAMEEKGLDLTMHASQAVTQKLLDNFHLVLCMEKAHITFIQKHFPAFKDRVFLLSEMIEENYEIEDPVGRSLEDYQITADHLLSIMEAGFSKIKSLSC